MRPIVTVIICLVAGSLGPTRSPIGAQGIDTAAMRAALQQRAGDAYKLRAVSIVPNDSAVIEFDDPAFTGAAEAAGTWMFGPPVPAVEQDSCPPPKILGRKIARVLWQHGGKEAHLKQVIVQVHGTVGVDRWSWVSFFYEPPQLDLPWAGDPLNLPAKP